MLKRCGAPILLAALLTAAAVTAQTEQDPASKDAGGKKKEEQRELTPAEALARDIKGLLPHLDAWAKQLADQQSSALKAVESAQANLDAAEEAQRQDMRTALEGRKSELTDLQDKTKSIATAIASLRNDMIIYDAAPFERAAVAVRLRTTLESLQAPAVGRLAADGARGDAKAAEETSKALNSALTSAVKVAQAADRPLAPGDDAIRGRKGVTFATGGHLEYGLSVSLIRFSTARQPDEPASFRNYTPELKVLPSEFGFQFTYHPQSTPWRVRRLREEGDNGGVAGPDGFQLLSAGGVLLVDVDTENFERGGLALAGMLGLFEDTIGLGLGFDLYRGIPVLGADGEEGGATAYTGILAWAFSPHGEVTPENVFVVLTINLATIANRLQGQVE